MCPSVIAMLAMYECFWLKLNLRDVHTEMFCELRVKILQSSSVEQQYCLALKVKKKQISYIVK